ncbi:MAG: RHS repeat-associated core domain-containing protein, partial [Candidatus Paceibacterota bacterium]
KEVWTSDDGQIWDRDANYEYREDGYLARTEIGEMKVQGMDYAYTLHGWLKSLNSGVLNPDYDMGKDGKTDPTVEYDNYEDDIHALHARDVLSYTIGYYEGDYKAITDGVTGFTNHLVDISGSAFETDVDELFNGNITSIISSTTKTDGTKQDPLATTYHYDQLHRFKESHVFTSANIIDDQSQYYNTLGDASRNNGTSTTTSSGSRTLYDYEVHVDYDQNGNITDLTRMSHGASNYMDGFTYNYWDVNNNNKLKYVTDVGTASGSNGDITDQASSGTTNYNYDYHSDGSLKEDEQEEIDYIDWYPNGKIKRIYRTSASEQSDVYFEYDPMGMRTLKVEITRTGTTINAADDWKFTYYGTDANGITMAVYDMDSTNGDLHRIESMIYGGSRLGMNTENETVSTADDLINDCNNDGLNSAVIQFGAFTPNNGSVVEIIHESVVISTLTWDTGLTTEEQVQTMVDDINAQASGYTAYNVEVSAGSIYYIHIKEDVAGAFTGDLVVELDDSPQSTYIKREPGIGKCFEDRILGNKFFELTNHLGSVNEVITDRKIAQEEGTPDGITDYFEADVVSYAEYYPFHMLLPGRHGEISGGNYRYGGAGMEKDDEVSGSGNSYTTEFRQYDPRLGRWKSLDPKAGKFPNQSPFVAFDNNPVTYTDPRGLEAEGIGKESSGGNNSSGDKTFGSESSKTVDHKDGTEVTETKNDDGSTTVKWDTGQYTVIPGTGKTDNNTKSKPPSTNSVNSVNHNKEPRSNAQEKQTPKGTNYLLLDYDNTQNDYEPTVNDKFVFSQVEDDFEGEIDRFTEEVQGKSPEEIYEEAVKWVEKKFPGMHADDGTVVEPKNYRVSLREDTHADHWHGDTFKESHGEQNVIKETPKTTFERKKSNYGFRYTKPVFGRNKTNNNIPENAIYEEFDVIIYIDAGNGTSIQISITLVQTRWE